MNWNLLPVVFSFVMCLLYGGVGLIVHMMEAEALSEQLSPVIDVDKDVLREAIGNIRADSAGRRAVMLSAPWALLACYLSIRLIVVSGAAGSEGRHEPPAHS